MFIHDDDAFRSAFATRRLGFQRMPEELFCDPEDTLREFE